MNQKRQSGFFVWYACGALALCTSMIILSFQTINRLSGAQLLMRASFFIAEKLQNSTRYNLSAQKIAYRCGGAGGACVVQPFSYKKIVHLGETLYAAA